jgi:ATP-dependent Clp protease adaptor protein ClpS
MIKDAKMSAANNGEGQVIRNDGLLLAEPEVKTKRPPYFKVVLLNDDYTPMDFVVFILKGIFHRNHEDAVSIMLEIHQKGEGVCGVYTRDVAETKAEEATIVARRKEYPLQCRVEKE